MILLKKRAHLVLKTPPAVMRWLVADVSNEGGHIGGTDREQAIPTLPREHWDALPLHPRGRTGLNLRHDLRGRPCCRQPHREVHMVRNAADAKTFAIQLACRSRKIGMQCTSDLVIDQRQSVFRAEDNMYQVEAQRLRHRGNYRTVLQPSPALTNLYLGLRPGLLCHRTYGPDILNTARAQRRRRHTDGK